MKDVFSGIIALFVIISVIALPILVLRDKSSSTLDEADDTDSSDNEIFTFQNYTYNILNTYHHDKYAFTQGLVYEDGVFYESTGLNAASSLRKVEPETGDVLMIHNLSYRYFGEGIALFDDRIIQLTYKSNKGFVYDVETFEVLGEFNYSTEGWGLTHNGENLIMSDGTSRIYLLDPYSFNVTESINVTYMGEPVTELNELEYIDGKIYANIWHSDRIAIIAPETGNVSGWLDLSGLLGEHNDGTANVLNGIAYDQEGDRLFVTGKLWPVLFEIELVPMDEPEIC